MTVTLRTVKRLSLASLERVKIMLTPEEMYMREHALATVMGATQESGRYGWGATIAPPTATKKKQVVSNNIHLQAPSAHLSVAHPNAIHSTSPVVHPSAHLSIAHPNAIHSTSPVVHPSVMHLPMAMHQIAPTAPTGRSYSVPSSPTGRFYGQLGTTPFAHYQIPSAPTGRLSTAPPPPPPQQGSHSWFNRPAAPLPQSSDYSASQSDMTAPDYSSYPHHHHHHHPHIPYDEAQIATQPSYNANVDMNYAQPIQPTPVYDDSSDTNVYDDGSNQTVDDDNIEVTDDISSADVGFGHWLIPAAVGALGYRFYRNSRWY